MHDFMTIKDDNVAPRSAFRRIVNLHVYEVTPSEFRAYRRKKHKFCLQAPTVFIQNLKQ